MSSLAAAARGSCGAAVTAPASSSIPPSSPSLRRVCATRECTSSTYHCVSCPPTSLLYCYEVFSYHGQQASCPSAAPLGAPDPRAALRGPAPTASGAGGRAIPCRLDVCAGGPASVLCASQTSPSLLNEISEPHPLAQSTRGAERGRCPPPEPRHVQIAVHAIRAGGPLVQGSGHVGLQLRPQLGLQASELLLGAQRGTCYIDASLMLHSSRDVVEGTRISDLLPGGPPPPGMTAG